MSFKLQELQETDSKATKLRSKEGYKEVEEVLHHKSLFFVPDSIWTKLMSRHHNNPLASHFGIKKTYDLLTQKCVWLSLQYNIEAYIKRCDICLPSKVVRRKPYGDLQSLPVPTHWWKDLSMDFVTGLPLSTNWKRDSYNSTLVIVDKLTKIVHYKPGKNIINASGLAKLIINMVVRHHDLQD